LKLKQKAFKLARKEEQETDAKCMQETRPREEALTATTNMTGKTDQLMCFTVLTLDDFHSVHSLYTTVKLVKTSVVLLLSGCTSHNQFSNRTVSSSRRRVATDVNGHQTICLN